MTHSTNTEKGFQYSARFRPGLYAGFYFSFPCVRTFTDVGDIFTSSHVSGRRAIYKPYFNHSLLKQLDSRIAAPAGGHKSCQIGASLVEVMISLLILSMGLLGMAALQGLGTQYGAEAYFRSQAVVQAYDMIDRMRANPTAVVKGRYEQEPIPTGYATDCVDNACTVGELADYDLVNWNRLNGELLPNGSGTVTRQGDVYTVQVTWQEDASDDGTTETQSYSLSARL